MNILPQIINEITIWSNNSTIRYSSKGNKVSMSNKQSHSHFMGTPFIIAKIWNQPRIPLTDEWIKKM
jgi:hypothetical protein